MTNAPEFRSIVISREYDAHRETVFNAWIEPAQIVRWFHASKDWTTPFAETDPRPGGTLRIGFSSPDGANDFVFERIYNEVVPGERLVFTLGDGCPIEVEFVENGGKTALSLTLSLEKTHSEDQQRHGWTAMLVHLGEFLQTGANVESS